MKRDHGHSDTDGKCVLALLEVGVAAILELRHGADATFVEHEKRTLK